MLPSYGQQALIHYSFKLALIIFLHIYLKNDYIFSYAIIIYFYSSLEDIFFHLFLGRVEGGERDTGRNTDVRETGYFPQATDQGQEPAMKVSAIDQNSTQDPSGSRPTLYSLAKLLGPLFKFGFFNCLTYFSI